MKLHEVELDQYEQSIEDAADEFVPIEGEAGQIPLAEQCDRRVHQHLHLAALMAL